MKPLPSPSRFIPPIPRFQVSPDALLLADRLRQVPVGEAIDYDALSDIIKRRVNKDARHVLRTARDIVLREDRIVFEAVRGGIKRLTDAEIAAMGPYYIKLIRRRSVRAERKVECANIAALPLGQQAIAYASITLFRLFKTVGANKNQKRVAHICARTQMALPPRAALEAQFGIKRNVTQQDVSQRI